MLNLVECVSMWKRGRHEEQGFVFRIPSVLAAWPLMVECSSVAKPEKEESVIHT